uniref:ATP synthase complex subunit 8 n=1 Tax=Pedetontinus luanchuanensis TaxID=1527581 RepID=A0A0B4N4Y5_9INSE|nr:ATP synthase subunit 8 [Pedetontinus luanchuanensis]
MPQMSPLSWLMLFIMFSMTYLSFLIMNYFNKHMPFKSVSKNKNLESQTLNWKW